MVIEDADEEAVRQLTFRLAAMEPDDPILQLVAERWLKLRMPAQEGDRALLEAERDEIRALIANLDEARYGRGEFPEPEDVERWERLRGSLLKQRRAVQAALDELGPPPAFDLGELLDTFRSRKAWKELPLQEKRALLGVALDKVLLGPTRKGEDIPIEDRVRVVLVGEENETARTDAVLAGSPSVSEEGRAPVD